MQWKDCVLNAGFQSTQLVLGIVFTCEVNCQGGWRVMTNIDDSFTSRVDHWWTVYTWIRYIPVRPVQRSTQCTTQFIVVKNSQFRTGYIQKCTQVCNVKSQASLKSIEASRKSSHKSFRSSLKSFKSSPKSILKSLRTLSCLPYCGVHLGILWRKFAEWHFGDITK